MVAFSLLQWHIKAITDKAIRPTIRNVIETAREITNHFGLEQRRYSAEALAALEIPEKEDLGLQSQAHKQFNVHQGKLPQSITWTGFRKDLYNF